MDTWGAVIILFAGMWMLQVALTFVQSKHYKLTIREMSAYGPGFLGVGVAKRKLGVGSVIVLVTDLSGKVVEAREMTGVTLFARFRKNAELAGKSIEVLSKTEDSSSRSDAIRMAVERIREQQRLNAEAVM
ncbi:transcriptional regulator GutM [Paenibacillus alkalitolerans]|uniref:transcriptional regulator GutM n=1 Tax=Paenibacillus alkalitolerans TaxID=2799335 RepID=UPI0018F343DE|nr:transcriptional regulator GutM [Paenibacillus alkalitolerans]